MAANARASPTIQHLLETVPQFGPTFDRLMSEEDGEMGSVQTMDELGRWALPHSDRALLSRVFAAVEHIYTDRSLRDGEHLAIEFFEHVCAEAGDSHAGYFGPATRAWFDRHCQHTR